MNHHVSELIRMPRLEAAWQGAIVRFPTMDPNDADAVGACLWADPKNQRVQPGEPKPVAQITTDDLLDALLVFARAASPAGARPARIEVCETTIYDALQDQLRELDIEIAILPSLKIVDAAIDGMKRMLEAQFHQMNRLENVPGMTVAHLRGFAEAARVFYEAEPWTQFGEMDLLRIVSPAVDKSFRYVNVMGSGGEEFGLAFFPKYQQFKKMIEAENPMEFMAKSSPWSVMFAEAESISPGDLETWQRLNLPLAHRRFYPLPNHYLGGDEFEAPSPDQLCDMELILRAVAVLKAEDFEVRSRKHLFIGTVNGPQKVVVEALRYYDPNEDDAGFDEVARMLEFLIGVEESKHSGKAPSAGRATRRRKRSR